MRRWSSLVLACLLFAACGSDDDTSSGTSEPDTVATTDAATTTTAAPEATSSTTSTTVVETTSTVASTSPDTTATTEPEPEPTTTTEPAPTTTGAPVLNGLDPACAEVTTDGSSGSAMSLPETFGPLGVEPVLSIELPAARSESDPTVQFPTADAVPVESGLLVGVRAPFGEFADTQLSLVGWDGTTRWMHCVEDDIVMWLAAPAGERVLLAMSQRDPYLMTWYEVDVATGEMEPTTLVAADASLYQWNDRVAVFGPSTIASVDPLTSTLSLVDLEDLSVIDEMPFPDGFSHTSLDSTMFELTPDDELLLLDRESGISAATALRRAGEWISDPAELAAARGIQPAYFFDDSGPSIVGADATGTTVWESGVTPISAEGFIFGRSGDVVVVAGCWEPLADGEEFCNRSEVGGLDADTGDVLWRLENDRGVEILADGYAIVTAGDGSGRTLLIDTDTGEAVPGQEWDEPGLFFTGCCDDQFNTATRFGGAVVTVHDRQVKVFLSES